MSPPPSTLTDMTTPCTWPVDYKCLPDDADPTHIRDAVDTAVGVLWALTGRRFGVCPTEARPCPPGRTYGVHGHILDPDPRWAGSAPQACVTAGCDRDGAILLPGPVHRVTGITVNGEDFALDTITVQGNRVWRSHSLPWPPQDLTIPSGQQGTWSLKYDRGVPAPPGAAHAVGALAGEFYQACHGDASKCRLPRRTSSVQRQGVTVTMVSPEEIFESGSTGLNEVDLWIKAHNPHRLSQPSEVWSPDSGVW